MITYLQYLGLVFLTSIVLVIVAMIIFFIGWMIRSHKDG